MTLLRSINNRRGYSMVELLVVISIIAILTAAGGPALSALTSSGGTNQNIAQLSGILEQAREYAVSQDTYVWVAFSPSTATTGFNQVCIAVVASTDGTDPAVVNSTAWQGYSYGAAPSGNLALISKVVTLKQVSLQNAATLTPTSLPAVPTVAANLNSVANNANGFFTIQLPGAATPTTFSQAVEFTPSGQARNAASPIDVIDMGVQPQKGTVNDTKNIAVLRVNGLTGENRRLSPVSLSLVEVVPVDCVFPLQ